MSNKSNKTRVSLDFTSEAMQDLEAMQEASKSASKAEVIRNALSLYSLFLSRKSEGYDVHFKKGDNDQKVEFVF